MTMIRFGLDLGGTKIEIIALKGASDIIYRKRVNSPQNDYQKTLDALTTLVIDAENEIGHSGSVGMGIPGSVSRKTGRVKNANSTWLIGEDLQGDLSKRLNRDVRLANDANCFALSEASDGAAKEGQVVFGVIIGTGCGGGIVVNGQILEGINAITGEWGHNPLPWQTKDDHVHVCYCGLSGCQESFLSGSGFAQHFSNKHGGSLTAKQISENALKGEKNALNAIDAYSTWLAKGLAAIINTLDPDVIVLGGGMSNIDSLYTSVPNKWLQWVFSDQVDTKLVAPKWGDASGVRGAAWLHPLPK